MTYWMGGEETIKKKKKKIKLDIKSFHFFPLVSSPIVEDNGMFVWRSQDLFYLIVQ